MVKLISFAALGLLSVAGQVVAQQTVKVMPFGASIVSVKTKTPFTPIMVHQLNSS